MKPDKSNTKKENSLSIYFINIEAEIINKVSANQTWQLKENSTSSARGVYPRNANLTSHSKPVSPIHEVSRTKAERHMIIPISAERALHKNEPNS